MYKILTQFIPGNNTIWVEKINPEDAIFIYDTEQEALAKIEELKLSSNSNREYKIVEQ